MSHALQSVHELLDSTRVRTHVVTNRKDEEIEMSANTKPVSDASFATDVLKAEGPVLVDFWAEWCGPCKTIAPALEELATEFAGKLTVAKVNIDDNPMTPTNYAVRGIPTLILFKDGKPAATQVGALPKSRLKEWLAGNL
jgi:thioredoxin 1